MTFEALELFFKQDNLPDDVTIAPGVTITNAQAFILDNLSKMKAGRGTLQEAISMRQLMAYKNAIEAIIV